MSVQIALSLNFTVIPALSYCRACAYTPNCIFVELLAHRMDTIVSHILFANIDPAKPDDVSAEFGFGKTD